MAALLVSLGDHVRFGRGNQLPVVSRRHHRFIGQAGANEQVDYMTTTLFRLKAFGSRCRFLCTLGPQLNIVATGLVQQLRHRVEVISDR